MQQHKPAPWLECQLVFWCLWEGRGGGLWLPTAMLGEVVCQFRKGVHCSDSIQQQCFYALCYNWQSNLLIVMLLWLTVASQLLGLWEIVCFHCLMWIIYLAVQGFPTRTCKVNSQSVLLGADSRSGSGLQVLHSGRFSQDRLNTEIKFHCTVPYVTYEEYEG